MPDAVALSSIVTSLFSGPLHPDAAHATAAMIPHYQPVPMPAPLWLLQVLLLVGFITHLIPMNVILTGGLVSAGLLGRSPHGTRFGNTLAAHLPVFLSVAITQGVVPLLFLQLIYGPLYYVSTVQQAWPWLSAIPVLIVAYYSLYGYKFAVKDRTKVGPVGYLLLSSLLFAFIGFGFVNMVTLMTDTAHWQEGATRTGWFLNVANPQVVPRFLHMWFGSLAVNGLVMGIYGLVFLKRDLAYGQWLIKTGAALYAVISLLQCGIGGWFLMSLPKAQMLAFMGHHAIATPLFMASMATALLSLLTALWAWQTGKGLPMVLTQVLGLVTVLGMVGMRAILRYINVAPLVTPELLPVKLQLDLLIAFLIIAVGLVIFLTWLIKTAWKGFFPEAK